MEKSIETIWKDGFLDPDALVAPRLNKLYSQKSKHIIDKFKRMFQKNLLFILVGSVLVLAISFIVDVPVMGIGLFIVANAIAVVNWRLQQGLLKINVNANSYQYIKDFDDWLKKMLAVNSNMARIYYPLIFISMVLGFWFSDKFQLLFQRYNESLLINGIPVYWALGVLVIAGLLAYFGGLLYKWDVNIVYGNLFRKLEEMLADMDELRV